MNNNDKSTTPKSVKKQTPAEKKKKTVFSSFLFLSALCIAGVALLFFLKSNTTQDSSVIKDFSSFLSQNKTESTSAEDAKTAKEQPLTEQAKPSTEKPEVVQAKPEKQQPVAEQSSAEQAKPTAKQAKPATVQAKPATEKPEVVQAKPTTKKPEVVQAKPTAEQTSAEKAKSVPPSTRFEKVEKGTARLVFLLDDAGHNLNELKRFTSLPFKVSIAVLPRLRYSKDAADLIRTSGKEILLHQPMQAVNLSVSPGPGAITPDMNYSEITEVLIDNVNEIGPIIAINNHEGSLITQSSLAMGAVLDFCSERNLFFLDSRTIASSVVREEANKRNMKILERSVFLDNTQDTQSIIAAIQAGTKTAKNKGSAIMIGHIWCENLADVLMTVYPELISCGYDVTTLTDLLINP